jgi:hypothetical protein
MNRLEKLVTLAMPEHDIWQGAKTRFHTKVILYGIITRYFYPGKGSSRRSHGICASFFSLRDQGVKREQVLQL